MLITQAVMFQAHHAFIKRLCYMVNLGQAARGNILLLVVAGGKGSNNEWI